MKKNLNTLLVTLLTLSLSAGFTACSSDNDDDNNIIDNNEETLTDD